ncbi:MAG: hypothetical protein LBU22_09830 [Dysgonamonadaceae bacterium]|jgi:hypothetical protein|nr:hypothetical protein [Dysgonamonadaceae bacterium]
MKETGYIKIIQEEGKAPLVEAQLVNDTVWMPKWKIARLFNVFNQKIEMNLRSIFKSHLLWEKDCSYTYRYTDKDIEKQIVYYNLEVLIFLSYRISSFEAQIFRQFVNSALREHLQKGDTKAEESPKLLWFFQSGKDYWVN